MEKGISFATQFINKHLTEEEQLEIQELVLEMKKGSPTTPSFDQELDSFFKEITEAESAIIRRYTGSDFIYMQS